MTLMQGDSEQENRREQLHKMYKTAEDALRIIRIVANKTAENVYRIYVDEIFSAGKLTSFLQENIIKKRPGENKVYLNEANKIIEAIQRYRDSGKGRGGENSLQMRQLGGALGAVLGVSVAALGSLIMLEKSNNKYLD